MHEREATPPHLIQALSPTISNISTRFHTVDLQPLSVLNLPSTTIAPYCFAPYQKIVFA